MTSHGLRRKSSLGWRQPASLQSGRSQPTFQHQLWNAKLPLICAALSISRKYLVSMTGLAQHAHHRHHLILAQRFDKLSVNGLQVRLDLNRRSWRGHAGRKANTFA